MEPQPLWEYPGTALALPTQVVLLDLKQGVPAARSTYTGTIALHPGFTINGLALWMDWQLDDTTAVSSGPVSEVAPPQIGVGRILKTNTGCARGAGAVGP